MNLNLDSKIIYYRKFVVLLFDLIFCFFATWLSLSLLYNSFHIPQIGYYYLYYVPLLIYVFVFLLFGTHKYLVRYTNIESIINLLKAFFAYSLIFFSLIFFLKINIKITYLINQNILFFLLAFATRIFFSSYFKLETSNNKTNNILIYGAGAAGINLFQTVLQKSKYNLIAFVDDDISKHKRLISGVQIISYDEIENYTKKFSINEIILAIPSLKFGNRRKIIKKLSKLNIKIKSLPDLVEYINNKNFAINDLSLNDLIDRNLKSSLNINNFYENKIVLITGGGGSIGSELSRQLSTLNPKKIIIFDHSEYNLYKITSELSKLIEIKNITIDIVSILGSIKDYNKLEHLFKSFKPDIVLHAAAYKHVNLLEENIIEGSVNNILGTSNILNLSIKFNVKNFLLVSTDKAVRPTNIMGATKRLSEILVLSESKNLITKTNFSIVRFGNVLGSSGSVIPLFNQQINNREPLTVTHPDVERYIMTVPEAVSLILESLQLSRGGEIFLLDMGKPVKIIDLARKLINLSGLTEKNSENLDGDIEIKFIGLRPGEKLSEELLIDSKSTRTSNENIYVANESLQKIIDTKELINLLEEYTKNYNDDLVIDLLKKHVEGFEKYYK